VTVDFNIARALAILGTIIVIFAKIATENGEATQNIAFFGITGLGMMVIGTVWMIIVHYLMCKHYDK